MRKQVRIFKALSDPNRLRILKMLQVRPLCVCEITSILNLATSTVSKHLSILRDVDLIYDVKKGKWVTYYLNDATEDTEVREVLSLVSKWFMETPAVQEDLKKVLNVDRYIICSK